MSTTVTYKGNTLTTAINQTRTLNTAGKYMEANVIITDVTQGSSSGVVYIIDEEQQDGSIVRYLNTEDAVVTTSVDSHGGTVYEITGEEVKLQIRRVTPTTLVQTITPDQGYDALSQVIINAIPSQYILPDGDNLAYGDQLTVGRTGSARTGKSTTGGNI